MELERTLKPKLFYDVTIVNKRQKGKKENKLRKNKIKNTMERKKKEERRKGRKKLEK